MRLSSVFKKAFYAGRHRHVGIAAVASILMIAGAHADDGARAYFALPAGTNDFELTTTVIHTGIDGSVFDSYVLTPSYRHTFDILGDTGTFLIGLPLGGLTASLATPGPAIGLENSLAQGDLFVGGTLGLLGAPALTPMEYAQFKPGLAVNISSRLFLPTGDYDAKRLLNIGGNRWSLQTNLPISYVLGGSLLDPQLTTFEIMPSVQVFGDNQNSFGAAKLTSEAPLFGVEGHITHSFTPAIWASADAAALFGGETSSDGVANGDAQQSLSLGGTLGVTFSPSVAVRLNYEEQVYSGTPNTEGRQFMATTAFLF